MRLAQVETKDEAQVEREEEDESARFLLGANALERPVLKTPYGKIRGHYQKSYDGRMFASYEGIPYAKPPIGNLRFKEPQPAEPWTGIWNANTTTACIQIMESPEPEGGYLTGQEDCLYLNVYVPKISVSESNLLDVFVHFHGGAFNFGYGQNYAGPKFLMDRDVVFVTLNYRLGPLGFLHTEDEVVTGNNGMKDQVEALKWVKTNIMYFGGNPNSVTITGLSAGGASVHYHFVSPLSKDLFHRGISTSGNTLCPWTIQEAGLQKARKLGNIVGCNQESTAAMVDCLKQRNAQQIVEAVKQFRPWLYSPSSPFGLVVDNLSQNPFLPEHPFQAISNGRVQDLPWITSITSDEGLYPASDFVTDESYLPYLENHWDSLAPHVLDYNYTIPEELHRNISQKIKHYYLKDKLISRNTFTPLIQMIGDRHFVVPAEQAARLQAKVNQSPVYFYYFSYQGEKRDSFVSLINYYKTKYGVAHGDDMMYVFTVDNPLPNLTPRDESMKNILLDMWTSFAKNNKPIIKDIQWKKLDKNASILQYLHIKSPEKLVIETSAELGHRSFWENIPFAENENIFKVKNNQ